MEELVVMVMLIIKLCECGHGWIRTGRNMYPEREYHGTQDTLRDTNTNTNTMKTIGIGIGIGYLPIYVIHSKWKEQLISIFAAAHLLYSKWSPLPSFSVT